MKFKGLNLDCLNVNYLNLPTERKHYGSVSLCPCYRRQSKKHGKI